MANGLPDLPGGAPNFPPPLLTSDASNLPAISAQRGYGIYLNGAPAITPDGIGSIEYKKEWPIPNYRQEAGAFQSYNKVALPFDLRVELFKGGNVADRTIFLSQCMALAESLNLYTVVMPEYQYYPANITHFDFRRTDKNGVGLLTVQFWFTEIQPVSNPSFSNTASPSGANATGPFQVYPGVSQTAPPVQ